jgi:RNA polymerase sigma-70 factor (ECF subfamily)
MTSLSVYHGIALRSVVVDDREEQQWAGRARAGDRDAFALLVERYWNRVYRWLHGLTMRRHLAEDLTQDVFLRAWSALPQLRQDVCFRSWLFRIARNALTDSRRDPRSTPAQPLPETSADRQPGPEELVLAQESETLLRHACAELPLPLRAALLLWTQEDLPYAEIAQVLGITEETARWRVCRARQLLLRRLGSHLKPEVR